MAHQQYASAIYYARVLSLLMVLLLRSEPWKMARLSYSRRRSMCARIQPGRMDHLAQASSNLKVVSG